MSHKKREANSHTSPSQTRRVLVVLARQFDLIETDMYDYIVLDQALVLKGSCVFLVAKAQHSQWRCHVVCHSLSMLSSCNMRSFFHLLLTRTGSKTIKNHLTTYFPQNRPKSRQHCIPIVPLSLSSPLLNLKARCVVLSHHGVFCSITTNV